RRAILAAAFDRGGATSTADGSCDKRGLLIFGKALPAAGSEAFERPETDLVLHPRRSLDPVAEVDERQSIARSPPDMIEDDVVPKPAARLMFRVVEAVDHRQTVALPIGQAGADEPARLPVLPKWL